MVIVIPEEIRALRKIFEPYCKGSVLNDDAPLEAQEAWHKYYSYDDGQGDDEQ